MATLIERIEQDIKKEKDFKKWIRQIINSGNIILSNNCYYNILKNQVKLYKKGVKEEDPMILFGVIHDITKYYNIEDGYDMEMKGTGYYKEFLFYVIRENEVLKIYICYTPDEDKTESESEIK